MKEKSVKVPALKGLLDRPLDLGCVELMERATNWSSLWGKAFRSLKPHGSSPERVLDLLCFLDESSDEKMRQTDLDDVTMEHLTAARSALQEVIREVELAVKKGGLWWNPWQLAPWLRYWRRNAPWSCLGSEDLPELRAMDARASMLMTRLKDEAKKENARCLQEKEPPKYNIRYIKIILTLRWNESCSCGFLRVCCWYQTTSATTDT